MQKEKNRFPEHFYRAYGFLQDDAARISFLITMLGYLADYVGEDTAVHCMDTALATSQGIGAAIVPKFQIVGGTGIRQQSAERSQLMLVKR